MKYEREEGFKPITITLETQEEIDSLYALLNYSPIFDVMNDFSKEWESLYLYLEKYQKNYIPYFNAIRTKIENIRK